MGPGGLILATSLRKSLATNAVAPASNSRLLTHAAHGADPLGTVLLVEDEESVREIASLMVCTLGYHVISVASGAEAIQEFRNTKERIDVVITDVLMPSMNGSLLAATLRGMDATVKIVFISGYFPETLQLPRDAISLQKPFSRSTLAAKLAEAMETTVTTPIPDHHPPTISAR